MSLPDVAPSIRKLAHRKLAQTPGPLSSRRHLLRVPLLSAVAAACTAKQSADATPQPSLLKRVVRLAIPPTLDYVSRVDRARDLQASRGEALRNGVEIEVVPVGTGSFAHELPDEDRLATARRSLAAGQRIDVVWTPFVDLGDLHRDRQIAPIASLAARDHLDLKMYAPQALQPAFAPEAGLMALPDAIAVRQIYFRTDHFAEAGIDVRRAGFDFESPNMTWDTVRRAALDAHASPAGKARFVFDPLSEALPATAWAWQAGMPVGRPTQASVGAVADALRWLGALGRELNIGPGRKAPNRSTAVRHGTVGPFPDGTAAARDDGSRQPILSGVSTIAVDSNRLVSTIASTDASLPIRVVELPRRDRQSRGVGWGEASGYVLMAGASDDAWDLLKYLAGEDAAYASARAIAMRLPPIERPGSQARFPEDLPGGPRWWFPPYSGRIALDRFLARQYRTGVKPLDEAHDHGMEQIRLVGIIPFAPGTRAWLASLETARRAVLREGRDPIDAARDAIGRV